MVKLLRNRWLYRCLILASLIALGVGVYRETPPEPRCTIDASDQEPLFLTADGGRVVTITLTARVNIDLKFMGLQKPTLKGPLQIWDAQTGEERSSHFKEETFELTAHSADGRFFAGEVHQVLAVAEDGVIGERRDAILLLDVIAGTVRELPLSATEVGLASLHFSPDSDFLVRMSVLDEKALCIYETATGRLIEEKESNGFALAQEISAHVLLHLAKTPTGNSDVEVWNWREHKPIGLLSNAGPNATRGPDGRWYVAERPHPERGQIGQWGVWNLRTAKLEAQFQSEDALVKARAISPDGRWLAATCLGKEWYVELRELPSGKQVATTPIIDVADLKFSPDGRFLVIDETAAKKTWSVRETPSLKELWKLEHDELGELHFSPDSATLFVRATTGDPITALHSATGETRAVFGSAFNPAAAGPLGMPIVANTSMMLTPDGRSILIQQSAAMVAADRWWEHVLAWIRVWFAQPDGLNDLVLVVDADTCRTRFRLDNQGAPSCRLSDDGSTLLTVHGDGTIRSWDLNAWKPLHWALGVPAGLGVLVVLWEWRSWRRAMVKRAESR